MAGSRTEIEIKLPFESAAAAIDRLARIGAAPVQPRHFEDNVLYDRHAAPLAQAGCLLRLRSSGDAAVLTFKAPVETGETGGPYKVRREFETSVGDPRALSAILDQLGFRPSYRYQKYRTTFSIGGLGICVDETPIGCFVELEGLPADIDRVAGQLGFDPCQYLRESYRELQLRHASRHGGPVGDLLLERSAP